MIVGRYGVHWAPGGIAFLVQSSNAQNLISADLDCPFTVNVRPRRLQCPHAIDLSSTAAADWVSDPLAQAFLPIPKTVGELPKVFLNEGHDALLLQLSRLCTPVDTMLRPIWWKQPQLETPQYGLTNLTPMVMIGVALDNLAHADRHISLAQAHNRRLILVCNHRVPLITGVEWIKTELTDVSAEPIEAIGAGALKEHMRHGP